MYGIEGITSTNVKQKFESGAAMASSRLWRINFLTIVF